MPPAIKGIPDAALEFAEDDDALAVEFAEAPYAFTAIADILRRLRDVFRVDRATPTPHSSPNLFLNAVSCFRPGKNCRLFSPPRRNMCMLQYAVIAPQALVIFGFSACSANAPKKKIRGIFK